MNVGMQFVCLAILAIGAGLVCFERTRFSAKEIAIIAVLAALASLGRVPCAVIPSAQPTTKIAKIAPMSQNRMTTFGSGQPRAWKKRCKGATRRSFRPNTRFPTN